MISFITPYSPDREVQLNGLIRHLKERYDGNMEYELIICEQSDSPFMRSQLRNLGYQKAIGDLIIFIDVDYRMPEYVDFYALMRRHRRAFVWWMYWTDVDEMEDGTFINHRNRMIHDSSWGGSAFTREQYERCGGYTNLMVGWGKMDNLLAKRAGLKRLGGELYHVDHPREYSTLFGIDGPATKHNIKILETDRTRNPSFDSFRQTIADCIEIQNQKDNKIRHFVFSNIGVVPDFAYMYEYERMRDLINAVGRY